MPSFVHAALVSMHNNQSTVHSCRRHSPQTNHSPWYQCPKATFRQEITSASAHRIMEQTTQEKNVSKIQAQEKRFFFFCRVQTLWQLSMARVVRGHPHQARSLLWDSLTSAGRSSMLSLSQAPGHHSCQAREKAVAGPLASK